MYVLSAPRFVGPEMVHINELREGLREIDLAVGSVWNLGKNLVVGWTVEGDGIQGCFAPARKVLSQSNDDMRLLDGPHLMDTQTFSKVCRSLRAEPLRLPLPFKIAYDD